MLIHWIHRLKLLTALETSLSGVLSFIVGAVICQHWLTGSPIIGGLWAMISAVVVAHVKFTEVCTNAKSRVLGTAIGCVMAGIGFSLLGYHYLAFFICSLLTVILCALLRISAYRLSCITIAIIFAVSQLSPYHISPWVNSLARFVESLVGVAIGLGFALLIHGIRKRYALQDAL